MDEWIRKTNVNGIEYFKNKYTGQRIFPKDLYDQYPDSQFYAPTDDSISYIIINTIDGQVRIPDDAAILLKKWSRIINVSWSQETDRTINVSSSYLTRLITISRACIQYISLEGNDELMDKKRDQINAMFGAHNRKEFTSFYDEEMELTSELAEFIESIGISETKSVVKSSNVWSISPAVSQMLLGTIVDPLDPNFTSSQYVTVAALSYLEHLKKTSPQEVEGLVVSPTLMPLIPIRFDMSENPITTWFPLNIMIGNVEIQLGTLWSRNRMTSNTMPIIIGTLTDNKRKSTKQVMNFIDRLLLIIPACIDPASRVFESV